jgi:hypothetical protein
MRFVEFTPCYELRAAVQQFIEFVAFIEFIELSQAQEKKP